MNNKKTGFMGLLLGGLIGAGIGLIYAPRSGEETRRQLAEEANRITENTRESLHAAQEKALASFRESQEKLEALNRETKERLDRIQAIAKTTLDEQKKSLSWGYKGVKSVMEEDQAAEKNKVPTVEI